MRRDETACGALFPERIPCVEKVHTDTFLKATPHKARLTALHAICLQIFRHIAQKSLAIRQYACGISMQSAEKSDYASYAQALCGVALKEKMESCQWTSIGNALELLTVNRQGKLQFFRRRPECQRTDSALRQRP